MIPIVQISDIPKKNKNDIKTSEFVDNLKLIRWYFNVDQNISFIFDKVKTNEIFPFTYCKFSTDTEYTKVHNNCKQLNTLIDNIQMFNIKNDNVEKHNEKFTNYIIGWYFNGIEYQRIFITEKFIEFQQTVKLNIKLKNIILDYLENTNIAEYIDDETIMKTKGSFYLWNIPNFNRNLFLDFIMNDNIARKFLTVRENISLQKSKKKNIKLTYIYPSEFGNLQLNLSIMIYILEKGQPIFKTQNWADIGLGNIYLSINMSTGKNDVFQEYNITSSLLNEITFTFAKILSVYSDNAESVQEYYKKFIDKESIDFFVKKTTGIKKRITLKDKVPEMFVNNYTRQCQKHQNGFLREIQVYDTKDEAEEAIGNKNLQYLAYPADEEYMDYVKTFIGETEILTPIPIDHKPFYFVCDNQQHTIPGLIVNNKLSNKNKFPYLPCCYAKSKPQLQKGTGLWNYLHGVNPNESITYTASDITIKGKIQLKPNVKGPLSLQIQDVFKIVKPDYNFMRIGVDGSRYDSFLSCLNKAIGIELDIVDMLNSEKSINIGLLKQTNYDMSIEEIVKMLENRTQYLDPRRVVPFFENFLNINIILFGDVKINDTYETTIIQPKNIHGYYDWEHSRKDTILIYLSTGSHYIQEERCELIIAEKNGKPITVFNRSIYEYLRYLTSNIYNQFSLFTPYYIFSLPSFFNGIKYQSIDAYGKVYRVQIDDYTLDTQPLPPIPNVKHKKLNIKPITSDQDLLELLDNSKYIIRDNKIIINKDQINIVVYIHENPSIINIQKYISEKHCANILKDIYVYIFSYYLNEYINTLSKKERKSFKLSQDIDKDFVSKFTNEISIIDNDTEFDDMTSFLLNHPPTFLKIRNYSVFKYPNKSCKTRLMYYLNLLIKHNPSYVLNYKHQIYLDHYYTCIYDFKQNPDYYITSSLDSLQYINKKYEMKDNLDKDATEPYFIFAPWTTRETPVLTINMLSVENALKLSTFWHTYRYIPEINDEGKFVYPEKYEIDYVKFNESKYTILDLDDVSSLEKIVIENKNAIVNKHIIAKKKMTNSDDIEKTYHCPLLY